MSWLQYFGQMKRMRGMVWRPLRQPWLWEFALVWRREKISRPAEEFIALAAKQLAPPAGSQRVPI